MHHVPELDTQRNPPVTQVHHVWQAEHEDLMLKAGDACRARGRLCMIYLLPSHDLDCQLACKLNISIP